MPTFEDPAADAEEAREALRGLAHATRSIDDPSQVYPVLGSLSSALSSLSQSLHQIAASHDGSGPRRARPVGNSPGQRAAVHQVSWELHRAGEVLRQVAASVDHAHQAEAAIVYNEIRLPDPSVAPTPPVGRGLGL